MSPPYRSKCTPEMPNPPDTCRILVMPRVLRMNLPRVASWLAHVSCMDMPRQLYEHATSAVRPCHVDCTDCTVIPFFACLTFRTERDIFSIRTPFDEVNIPPKSGRRDRRNGIGFVAFRALSFLSIFQALSGFWIRFRINFRPVIEQNYGFVQRSW